MKHTFARQLLNQGIAASKAGHMEDARRLLLQAIELDPNNAQAWMWLSGVADSLGERRHCLEQVLRIDPDNAHARAGLAWLAQQVETKPPTETSLGVPSAQDQPPDAGETCPFCRGSVPAHSLKCSHCERDLVVACPNCAALSDVEETTCRSCGYQLGDFRQGAVYFAHLGDAYLANLKTDRAATAWQRVLEMDADYPKAFLRLGEAQTIKGDHEGAHASFQQAVRRSKDPVAAQLAMGQFFERRHEWDKARQTYERALATDEQSAAAHFALGRLLAEGRALKTAFPHIRRATELDPQHAGAWFLLGQLYEMAQEVRKAIQAYEQAKDVAEDGTPDNREWRARAAARLETLRPSVPPNLALNWSETVRQTASLVLVPALAALVNGGLLPWQIAVEDYLGTLIATLGAYFWISASNLPQNPGMRAMLGQEGLSLPVLRTLIGLFGGLFWSIGLLYILLAPILS